LFTQPGILRDDVPDERKLGMFAGFAWIERADATVVYTDCGVSSGMRAGVTRARSAQKPIEIRSLGLAGGLSFLPTAPDQAVRDALNEAHQRALKGPPSNPRVPLDLGPPTTPKNVLQGSLAPSCSRRPAPSSGETQKRS
jgi:hypothetical protein